MATVRTTEHLYNIDVYPVDAMPGTGYTWAAKVLAVHKVIDGTKLHLAQPNEHYGATAGGALDKALEEAMESLVDENPS